MIRASLAALAIALPAAATSPSTGLPEWLAGRWCTVEGARGQTCEQWLPAAGGMMLGVSQTVRGGKTSEFEFMRIAMDGDTAVYLAQPGGKPPVAFRAVAGGEGVTFVNAAHDYPQRIHYRVKGDALTAEISLADGRKPMRFNYRRVR
ncbi:DUF6265 family protein [Sphingomonas sp. BT-65]|uniref:DUF6265 family protein n=1 Tax=Sphingomonas sp. BT-65 TaxID=2989821 RepID=UPI002235CAB9|nr:DUF6265 family protein [Sphingomonas sp. BT-65]MCW4461387.1 DUF6265 family protein [Sphingomonas sp. BT-65]